MLDCIILFTKFPDFKINKYLPKYLSIKLLICNN